MDDEVDRKIAEIREDYICRAAEWYDDDFSDLDSVAESPIERLMAAALVAAFSYSYLVPDFIFWGGKPPEGHTNYPFIASQVPLGERLRIDFVIFCNYRDKEGGFAVAVECDGHDFHERTKQQARRDRSRDRVLQIAGWSVLRFTGAEIWADALKCAEQVRELVHKKYCE